MNRMELYNQLENILKEMESNEHLKTDVLLKDIHMKGCVLSNTFGEYSDAYVTKEVMAIDNFRENYKEVTRILGY